MSASAPSPPIEESTRKRSRTSSPSAERPYDGEAELVRIKRRLIKVKQLRERGSSFGVEEEEDRIKSVPNAAATATSVPQVAAALTETPSREIATPQSPGFRILGSSKTATQIEEEEISIPERPVEARQMQETVIPRIKAMPRSHLAPRRNQHPPLASCRSVYSYTRLNHIEEGAYGIVFRARCNDTGGIYALKKLKLEEEKQGFPITSLREVMALMVTGGHENVVGVREIVVGDTLNQ
jgi:hypothetical protein